MHQEGRLKSILKGGKDYKLCLYADDVLFTLANLYSFKDDFID